MYRLIASYAIILFSIVLTMGQTNTMGLLHNDGTASDGYTLFSPERNNQVYLINNCGQLVNEWTFSEQPSLTAYLLEDGSLLRVGKDSLEKRDWDNSLIWSFAFSKANINQHHDIEPLPNGNILCIIRDVYSQSEMTSIGRDLSLTSSLFRLDKIVELEPVGANDANIVWEWKFRDHMVQNMDPLLPNYGRIDTSFRRLNVNYNNGHTVDWTHLNSVHYNESLDQIIISARHLNEIYIIDHSTTTAEAARSTGGTYGYGGDFLWRWGNPDVYGQSTPQNLGQQHDAQWAPTGSPSEGKICVFNNEYSSGNKSAIQLIDPLFNGLEYEVSNNIFGTDTAYLSWPAELFGSTVYESKKGGVQPLENGNFLICETSDGLLAEVDTLGNLIWAYRNPSGSLIHNQYEASNGTNTIFRGKRYNSDYPGLLNQDLHSNLVLEAYNELTEECATITNLPEKATDIYSYYDNRFIFNQKFSGEIQVINQSGQQLFIKKLSNINELKLDHKLNPGLYFISLMDQQGKRSIERLIIP